jgi:tetratricopeptide (TPR) repeat protein
VTPLALVLALVAQGPFPSYARAESLLAAGDLRAALDTADRLVAQHPSDANALVLLGRIHFVRPVVGRYQALAAFRAAARLAPANPAPLYWQMQVGFHLGSDEGDRIAREALLVLFAITPDYADTWSRFGELYQGPDIWRRAEGAFAHHPDHPVALERRAELLIALEEPLRAESLLVRAAALRPATAGSFLLRAELSFLAGRDSTGYAWHDSALAQAGVDSAGALWGEAEVIAGPEEIASHAATPPGERRAFFERFWSRRDPNLVTPENERVGEQYRRRAEARRMYRLLHPQRMVYRSATARALQYGGAADVWALQDTALPLASRAGVDARGLMFLRHGPPDQRAPCILDLLRPLPTGACSSALELEGWLYWTPEGPLTVGFKEGGEYFGPASSRQVRSIHTLLTTDRTALPAPLVARGWSAFFKSGAPGRTDAYFKAAPGTAAVVLWDAVGNQAVRASSPGMMVVTVPPGHYDYGFDVDSAGVVGRLRGAFTVPGFSSVDLGLSSLVLAPADSLTDREVTLAAMPADLVFDAGAALAIYAEVYGLTPDPTGRARYQVRYAFAPVRSLVGRLLHGVTPVVFEFARDVERRERVAEQLILEAGRVPPGRYRVSLAVTDLWRNVKSESVALEITIR